MTTTNIQANINKIAENRIAEYTQTIKNPPVFSNSEDVARFANQVAQLEGELTVYNRIPKVDERPLTNPEMQQLAFLIMANGPDDQWSGRGNDARRSHFDGVRKAAEAINDSIRFGE